MGCPAAGAVIMRHRLAWCLLVFLSAGTSRLGAVPLSTDYAPGDRYMGVQLLGTVRLERSEVKGLDLSELSGLAWDADEGLFYAVSDEGALFHLKPDFEAGRLTGLEAVAAYPLRDRKGRPLKGGRRDAEGLALRNGDNGVRGDAELLVSFEVRPRLRRYSPTGRRLGKIRLPAMLKDRRRYDTLNRALETVAIHPRYGVLTAPERPMKGAPKGEARLYSTSGKGWAFRRAAHPKASLVGMDVLSDGSLLVLERAYSSLFEPFIVYLRQLWLSPECEIGAGGLCHSRSIARFDSSEGWLIDNFEGLTRYGEDGVCIVSDDSRRWFQRTLLSCFRLNTSPVQGAPH